mgnify:CR=1 FL=1
MYNTNSVKFKVVNNKFYEGVGIVPNYIIRDINNKLDHKVYKECKENTFTYYIRTKTLVVTDKRTKEYKRLNN